MFNIEMCLCNH